ncbi:putative diguanylate cyclase YdaM [Mariniblastus fucicola]|uniref:diguanylate cyclase n=2 Tax=Mariniblastus fucicola TaxID=980251 RepID=A0A5B9PNN3_9BACT|nr:putative diguanylate cyclase YdaM [Mariniblastus fucicola]
MPEDTNKVLFPYLSTLFWYLREGVIFVDREYNVGAWSQAVESITGRDSAQAVGQTIRPSLLSLHSSRGEPISADDCPVAASLQSGKIRTGDYRIIGPSGREVKVELTVTPVIDDNIVLGAVILIYDSSVQLDLQRQLKDLYETSVLDPLTQVANRAEFERVLSETIVSCKKANDFNASIIICDIDFFKSINDNFNHHIGDLALVAFANQLQEHVRAQDLVCRYGGEEFVILCAQCDVDSAIDRAEQIRMSLEKTAQPMLDGKCITASFGVTQLRGSDSATDFFVRADSALLKAKEMGRNRVVAVATPQGEAMKSVKGKSLSGVTWKPEGKRTLLSEEFVTQTPISVLVEKLRGFIMEFDAEIRHVQSDFASVEVEIENRKDYSQRGRFRVSFEFCEKESAIETGGTRMKSYIKIVIREAKRSWFATNCKELAPTLLAEIRHYLMLNDESNKIRVDSAGSATPGR